MRKIDKIGIELEGAWNRQPTDPSLQAHGDGSVHISTSCTCADQPCSNESCINYVGEIVSLPFETLDEALEWTKKFYPKKSNRTCGMHIHISPIDKGSYMRLMTKSFWNYFLKQVTAWGVAKNINEGTIFWERLTGQNKFCLKKFTPEEQIKHTQKAGAVRYTHLNYCYGVHGTVECRLFPAFQKPALSLSAIELYYNIVDSFLNKRNTEKPMEITIKSDDSELGNFEGVRAICV